MIRFEISFFGFYTNLLLVLYTCLYGSLSDIFTDYSCTFLQVVGIDNCSFNYGVTLYRYEDSLTNFISSHRYGLGQLVHLFDLMSM